MNRLQIQALQARHESYFDGTVPHRSGIAPKESPSVKALLQVNVGHEPAYRDSELARHFTLRAIVQIAQEVKKTSLHYG
ncbi:MAG: hypothetical protein HHJ12_00010 [Glaciimonas sp.]|nr:hypothetical protein [Glaciimonas sp.]